ncbi:MAG: hypothetical protein UW68_C0003G0037 [Candidatus Collierbacteria bacterium GW2011_GWB1_44_6]|uniref:Uncharacterized protein n=1 Tax=Candidatus Collierbacteria bacterium GW2011_GWB1_44_6 TaxID=1618384 RepID=A0A0G1JQA4_9BACT|nr:MAG: hypothetical protein UW68_C0003G0037 [Candidatus Collierbacteria bacterium GW2011_GWB1_44_6]
MAEYEGEGKTKKSNKRNNKGRICFTLIHYTPKKREPDGSQFEDG